MVGGSKEVDDAGPELAAGTQQVYDHARRAFGGLHLTHGITQQY
jgi:hypothetical protein